MSFLPPPNQRRKVAITFDGSGGLTEQHHKETVDIHTIMRKYQKTGVIEHVNQYQGTYGDFSSAPDLHTAYNAIAEAEEMFQTVPSHIREKFNNQVTDYLEFMQNPENAADIRELGLSDAHLETGIDVNPKYKEGQRYYSDPEPVPPPTEAPAEPPPEDPA